MERKISARIMVFNQMSSRALPMPSSLKLLTSPLQQHMPFCRQIRHLGQREL